MADGGTRAGPEQPPPWTLRLILTVLLAAAGALAAYRLFQRLRDLIVWLVIALFLSFALEPAVNWLHAHGWRRGLATGAVMLALVLAGAVLVATMVPVLVSQIRSLVNSLPGLLDRADVYTERWFHFSITGKDLAGQIGSLDSHLKSFAANIAGNLFGFGAAVLTAVFEMLTIALFTFYFVAEGPKMRRTLCSMLSPRRQREVLWAWETGVDKMGAYIYSRAVLAAINGTLMYVVLKLLGIPFALPLAVWTGVVAEFVPTVGTYIAAVIPLLVALLDRPIGAAILLVYIVVYQQVENYLLSPRISGRTMSLHPAVAFAAAIAGASLSGIVGAFLALPAAAMIQAGIGTWVKRHEVVDSELTRDV